MKRKFVYFIALLSVFSCRKSENIGDMTGVFETEETIVSSEIGGKIISFNANEGDNLDLGQKVVQLDCSSMQIEKQRAEASLSALQLKQSEAGPQIDLISSQIKSQGSQIAVLKEQLESIKIEKNRIQKLVDLQAVPSQQLDDINGKYNVIIKQIDAANTQLSVLNQQKNTIKEQIGLQNRALNSEKKPMLENVALVENTLNKCEVVNPVKGVLIIKYAEQGEIASPGKALYKVGNLDNMILRAYASADVLSKIKIGQDVKVLVDDSKDSYKTYPGKIEWIASEAEFTPKTIQTKEERANLVYAVKIKVKNDSFIKIGMYGEVKLND